MRSGSIVRKILRNSNLVLDFPTSEMEKMAMEIPDSTEKHFLYKDACEIFVGSWNVGGVSPPEYLDMEEWLMTHDSLPLIYVLGFQEIVALNIENIIRSEKKRVWRKWNCLIRETLNKKRRGRGDEEEDFECIISKQMVGIFLSVWVRNDISKHILHPTISLVSCGFMGCLPNKGSISVRFMLYETSFCFVSCHLASGRKEGDRILRNSNVAEILRATTFDRPHFIDHRPFPRKILDHDMVVWLGDLNYRIELSYSITRSLVEKRDWRKLLENDQLRRELMEGHVLEGWEEGEIGFPPTYKYSPNSSLYVGTHHNTPNPKTNHSPAWCDRIIWFGRGMKQRQYRRGECRLSDHRPVSALFTAEIDVSTAKEDELGRPCRTELLVRKNQLLRTYDSQFSSNS